MVGTKLDSPSFQTSQLMVPYSRFPYFVDELYVEHPNAHFKSGWPVGNGHGRQLGYLRLSISAGCNT